MDPPFVEWRTADNERATIAITPTHTHAITNIEATAIAIVSTSSTEPYERQAPIQTKVAVKRSCCLFQFFPFNANSLFHFVNIAPTY